MTSEEGPRLLLWDIGTRRDELNEPIGIEALGGFLKASFPQLQLRLHWSHSSDEDVGQVIQGCDVLGLSAKAGNLRFLNRVMETVRSLHGKPLVVIGNMLATLGYDAILREWPEVICAIGEGESAIAGIVQAIRDAKGSSPALAGVPNLAYMEGTSVRQTARFQEELSSVPLPYREFLTETIARRGIIRVEGSRGCPWCRCTFCCIKSKYGARGWRPFPDERVVADLAAISKAGGKSPYFTDEDFFGPDTSHARSLCDAILGARRDGSIHPSMDFFISARSRSIVEAGQDGTLDLMKRAGIREVFVGLESGSLTQLRRYGKEGDVAMNNLAIGALAERGLEIDIGFILFDPDTTFGELLENVVYLEGLCPVIVTSRPTKDLRVQPFTALQAKYAREGVLAAFDLNKLEFPWKCKDDRVGGILTELLSYEAEDEDDVYRVQAASRGEVSPGARQALDMRLRELRNLDWRILSLMIEREAGSLSRQVAADSIRESRASKKTTLEACLAFLDQDAG